MHVSYPVLKRCYGCIFLQAKTVLNNIAVAAKAGISEKGLRAYSLDSAEAIKVQGLEAYAVCMNKGAVEGVKVISGNLFEAVTAALEEAKKEAAVSKHCCNGGGDSKRAPAHETLGPSGMVSEQKCAEAENSSAAETKEVKEEEYSSADEA